MRVCVAPAGQGGFRVVACFERHDAPSANVAGCPASPLANGQLCLEWSLDLLRDQTGAVELIELKALIQPGGSSS